MSAPTAMPASKKLPGVLYWLAFGTFATATDAFLIAGLLPGIAKEFDTDAGTAGYLMLGFALTYAVAAPLMATLSGRMDRRAVMQISLGGFVLACIAAALAPSFAALLAIRIATAFVTCLYMPAATALGASLVPPAQRGRALALVMVGLTVGPAIGVPLGTFVGGAFDWRVAFLADAGLGAVAFLAVTFGVARGYKSPVIPLRQRLAPLGQGAVLNALLVTAAWVGGGYTLYTYLTAYLAPLGVAGAGLVAVLALFGVGAFAGNLMGGWASDRLGAPRVLAVGIGGLALSLAGLAVAPSLPYALPFVLVLLAVWSVLGFLVLPARQSQLVALAPQSAPLLLALNASAMYVGIAAGAALGGVTLAHGGPADLAWTGTAVELAALLFLAAERRATAFRARAAAAPAE